MRNTTGEQRRRHRWLGMMIIMIMMIMAMVMVVIMIMMANKRCGARGVEWWLSGGGGVELVACCVESIVQPARAHATGRRGGGGRGWVCWL